MGQSNAIFAALLIAFIVFITARGELGTYLQILRGGGQKAAQQSGSSGSQGGSSNGFDLGNISNLFSGFSDSGLSSIGNFLDGQSNGSLSLTQHSDNPVSTPGF